MSQKTKNKQRITRTTNGCVYNFSVTDIVCFYVKPVFMSQKMKNEQTTGTTTNECVCNFSVNYRAIDTSNIIDIHKYLMKKHVIKQCLG